MRSLKLAQSVSKRLIYRIHRSFSRSSLSQAWIMTCHNWQGVKDTFFCLFLNQREDNQSYSNPHQPAFLTPLHFCTLPVRQKCVSEPLPCTTFFSWEAGVGSWRTIPGWLYTPASSSSPGWRSLEMRTRSYVYSDASHISPKLVQPLCSKADIRIPLICFKIIIIKYLFSKCITHFSSSSKYCLSKDNLIISYRNYHH